MTEKEKAVLEMIETQISETGVSPSYAEIKDHFGFASFNSVQNYLKQLAAKGYIQIANNQKRAIQIMHSSDSLQQALQSKIQPSKSGPSRSSLLQTPSGREEVLDLPLLGKVAAGQPLEALTHDEFIQVPRSMVRNPDKSYALKVKGSSMIEDGIFDGDIILIQKQNAASNGEIVVASVENESTVKRFYLRPSQEAPADLVRDEQERGKLIELRPANSSMQSMWYSTDQVQIQGIVIALIRKF